LFDDPVEAFSAGRLEASSVGSDQDGWPPGLDVSASRVASGSWGVEGGLVERSSEHVDDGGSGSQQSITASSLADGEPRSRDDLDPRWEAMARVGQLIN